MQQYQLCSTASSKVCQHCSEMLKSPKCKFSRSFRVVHILGPICLRMALFLIPFDCSLESFPHVFPQQASPIACLCSSAHVVQERISLSLLLLEVGGEVAGASSLSCAGQLASSLWRMCHLLQRSNSGGKNVIERPFRCF